MKIDIQLKRILQDYSLDKFGIEKQIAKDLGLNRHVIGRLYRNQASRPSLPVLGKICEWLIEHGVPASLLPGALFGSEPSALWKAVTQPGSVIIYLGEYLQAKDPGIRWVSRRDLTVASEFLRHLSTPNPAGNAAGDARPSVSMVYVPFRFYGRSKVDKAQSAEDVRASGHTYKEVKANNGSHAAILIGSQKVNYLVEHFVADLFGGKPFELDRSKVRVPFHLAYPDSDFASCFGGPNRLPGQKKACESGLHYLDASGNWTPIPWKHPRQDAGAVISEYEHGSRGVKLAVFGFSGRGTEALGRELLDRPDAFWKSHVDNGRRRVSVCFVRLKIADTFAEGEAAKAAEAEVIPLDKGILKKYLA